MKQILLGLTLALLSGCASLNNTTGTPARDPTFAAARPAPVPVSPRSTGSIYQTGGDMRLFENQNAHRVGDILTVTLSESQNGKKKVDQSTQKKDDVSVNVPMLFGQNPHKIFGMSDRVFKRDYAGELFDATVSSSNTFKGTGSSDQSNSLSGTIAVTVVEVLPNGNLRIQGEKRMTINQGDEFVRLSGYIRPADIDATNTVESTRVADATIIYTGEGALADSSRMGWFSRFFNSPLFPF